MRYSKQKESREQGMKETRLLRIASNITLCIASYDINLKQDAIVKKKLIDCKLYWFSNWRDNLQTKYPQLFNQSSTVQNYICG